MGHSRYFALTVQEAAASWRRRNLIINAIAIVLTLAAFFSYAFAQNPPFYLAIVLFVAYLCIFFSRWVYMTRNTSELYAIVTHDCDPAKLVEVIDILMPTIRTRGVHRAFSTSYAICSSLMGYDDVALAWVNQIEAENPRDAGTRLSLISTRVSVAKHRDDSVSLRSLRPWVQSILGEAGGNRSLTRAANMLLATIDSTLAFISGDYDAARSHYAVIEGLSETPQTRVVCEFNAAALEAALGNDEAALPHYRFVAEHGGTLVIREQAREWLASHDQIA